LLAAFNTREPVNKVLTTIVDRSEFFKGRVDETSKTLPKLSQSVFLLNNVRAFVKELLVGDYAIAEDALARYTEKLLSTPEQRELFVNRALQLIDVLTAKLEPWNEIVKISVDDTMASRIPDLRKNYISLTATGLVIIGRVAFEINKWLPEAERFSKYIELASNVDWKREAEIWQGSIILEGGKLVTNRAPVALAAQRVKELLGLADLQAVKDAQTASVAA
jgi:DNA sulfur modification protein DndB